MYIGCVKNLIQLVNHTKVSTCWHFMVKKNKIFTHFNISMESQGERLTICIYLIFSRQKSAKVLIGDQSTLHY